MTDNDRLPVGPVGDAASRLPARTGARDVSTHLLSDDARADPEQIDLLAYWKILVKRRWLVASCVIAALLLAAVFTLIATPLYRATAVVKIDNQAPQIMMESELASAFRGWDPEFLETQIGLLQSRALAERVADDLEIDRATLDSLQPPGWFDRLGSLVRPGRGATPAAGDDVEIIDEGTADDTVDDGVRDAAIATVGGGISVKARTGTRLVDISFVSTEPRFAARVANAVADGFIASEIDRQFGASSYARTYLEEQLAIAKDRLESSERALVDFAQKESLVDLGEGQSLVGRNLADLNSSLAQAQAQRIRAQSRMAQAGADSTLPNDVLATSMVPALRQQRADLNRRYQEQLQIFKPDYPDMQKLKGQMDELDKQIAAEYAAARRSLKAELDAAMANETMLRTQLASLRDETLDTDNRSIQYNILRREADTNRQLYDSLLQRYKAIGVAADVRPNNIAIIDRATVPGGPFTPDLMRNLMLALALGLLLGAALAILVEFLDDTLKTPEDIEQRLKQPVLGIIPKIAGKQSVAQTSADPRSAFSEAYRSVRTALQFSTDEGVPATLLITSSGPGEGKSTSSLALARNFAQLGKRVLLIEADLRNPSLHRSLALRSDRGMSNLLAGNGVFADVVIRGEDGGPDVMLAGPLPPNPAELLAGPRLGALLDIAARDYDQIIIDGPPVLGIADSPLLSHVTSGTLLVVDSGRTRIRDAQSAIKRLVGARAHLVGVLLTKYDARAAGHGYQYEGYYAYGGAPRLGKQ